MKKTKKISIISAIIALVFVSGLLVLSHSQTLAYVSGGPGVQTAGGDGDNDPCANYSSDQDSAENEACGGGGGGTSGNPYQPPKEEPKKEEPKKAAFAEVTVFVQDSSVDPVPTGKITADRSSCVIEDGKNTCDVKFTWSVTNPDPEKVATVKRDPVAGPVINKNSGSEILPVYYWLDSEQNISKYSLIIDKVYKTTNPDGTVTTKNSLILDSASVKATCKTGSSWVASLNQCVRNVSVNKFSTSNCIIPEGGSSCNANISWEVSGGTGNFAVTTTNNIIVASGKSGNTTYGVEYPSRDFYLYNDGNELAKGRSYSDCVEGTAWSMGEKKCISVLPPEPPIIEPVCPSGTIWDELQKKCVTMGHDCPLRTTWSETQKACLCDNGATNPPTCNQGLLSFDVKDCIIKPNESTCQTKLNWASTLSGSFGITTPEQITVSAASSGTDVPYTVEYPSRKFFAYNNGNLVEEKVAYAKCEEGNIWSMTDNKCVSEMLCAGELERDIYFDCPVGYEGKIIRKQFKTFPGCAFEEPATEENTVLINNNCRSKDDPDPQWTGRSCNECSEGVEQVYCTETNENGDVREFIMNCPGDVGGGGSGQSVLNIEIKATPEKIMKGRLSTITWSSNADSCRAIPVPGYLNDFNTGEGNRPNGFDTVKPLSNNLYKIECTKGEITESKMIEVKVSSLNIIEL